MCKSQRKRYEPLLYKTEIACKKSKFSKRITAFPREIIKLDMDRYRINNIKDSSPDNTVIFVNKYDWGEKLSPKYYLKKP